MKHNQNKKYIPYALRKLRCQRISTFVPTNFGYEPNKSSNTANFNTPANHGEYSSLVRAPLIYKPALKVKECQLKGGTKVASETSNDGLSEAHKLCWKHIIINAEHQTEANTSATATPKKQKIVFRWFFDEFTIIRQNVASALLRFKSYVSRFYGQT